MRKTALGMQSMRDRISMFNCLNCAIRINLRECSSLDCLQALGYNILNCIHLFNVLIKKTSSHQLLLATVIGYRWEYTDTSTIFSEYFFTNALWWINDKISFLERMTLGFLVVNPMSIHVNFLSILCQYAFYVNLYQFMSIYINLCQFHVKACQLLVNAWESCQSYQSMSFHVNFFRLKLTTKKLCQCCQFMSICVNPIPILFQSYCSKSN